MCKPIITLLAIALIAAPSLAQDTTLQLSVRNAEGQGSTSELQAASGDTLRITLRNEGAKLEVAAIAVSLATTKGHFNWEEYFVIAMMPLGTGETYSVDLLAPRVGPGRTRPNARAIQLPPSVQHVQFELLAGGIDARGVPVESNRLSITVGS